MRRLNKKEIKQTQIDGEFDGKKKCEEDELSKKNETFNSFESKRKEKLTIR